jgi:hypothetical protein
MITAQQTTAKTTSQTGSQSSKYAYLLFLIQPAITLALAIRNYRASWAKNIVWLFTIFYGLTFAISPDSGADSVRYRDTLIMMHLGDWDFSTMFSLLYADGSRYVDIYQPLLTFIVSRFTDNYQVLFALFGFFLGYLYSRNIWYLLERAGDRLKPVSVLLIVVFAFIVGISSGINGVRFWTATHLFFFGLLPYLVENKKSGVWIAASASLVHFTFLLPTAVLLIYMVVGNRKTIYFAIFVASFVISEIDMQIVRDALSYLPGIFQDRTYAYTSEGMLQRASSDRIWFLEWSALWFKYTIAALAVYLFIYNRSMLSNPVYLRLFSAGLLFYGVFNILSHIPSVGRFLSLAAMVLFALFFWVVQHQKDRNFEWLIYIAAPGLLLYLAVSVRMFMEWASYLVLIANPVLALFMDHEMGLYDFIRLFI